LQQAFGSTFAMKKAHFLALLLASFGAGKAGAIYGIPDNGKP
jgi:hypothetical protein